MIKMSLGRPLFDEETPHGCRPGRFYRQQAHKPDGVALDRTFERLRQRKVKTMTVGGESKHVRVPLARDSVRIIHATLRGLVNAAVDDGVIVANPADKLGRGLRLVINAKTRQEEVKAMTRDQLAAFLGASRTRPTAYERRHYPRSLLLARTGMRLGEGLALQWDDVHFGDKPGYRWATRRR